MTDEIIIAEQGALGRITLNRPRALNALTLPLLRAIQAALDVWRGRPEILAVAADGAGTRGFCAGGDIRAVHASVAARDGMAETFWREEFPLNAMIASYPKPYVVLMDGLVMGGGVGVSAHGSHRLVTDTTAVAMPETGIGFFPDVGATWLLSRAPGEVGTYLGLTGARMGAADAIFAGFADRLIERELWPALLEQLAGAQTRASVLAAIASADAGDAGPALLAGLRPDIDRHFAGRTVEAIVASLRHGSSEFAERTLKTLSGRCPMSLKVSLAALRHARTLPSLVACLGMESRMVLAMAARPDFLEGIRAAVIDKDQRPKWSPAALADIDEESVRRIVHG